MASEFPPGDTSAAFAQSLKAQLRHCAGFDGDELARNRKDALDYYFQRPRGDEVAGRADVVSGDVSAMVEATLAQMIESFSSDRICDFDPLDAADEDQAQLESEAVQYFVMGRENGFLQLSMAIKEALLMRNGAVKIEAVDRVQRRTRRLGNVEPEALAQLIASDDVVSYDYDEQSGELAITREITSREFEMHSVSLDNFLYFKQWHKPTLEGIPICAERHIDSRAELVALGFPRDRVNNLTPYKANVKTESQARDPRTTSYTNTAIDSSQDQIEWFEVYVRVASGGADELRRIALHDTDGVILDNVPVSRIRLAAGTAIINPHRFTGISLYDKLKQVQDNRTALRRALHDNINASNRARLAGIDGIVNSDDVTDGRVNNLVRVKNVVQDVRQALMPITVQDTSANILANLESTARERSEMGGAALDLQTANMQIGGDRMGSQGLDRAYSVAEQLSALMMKTIAATLIRDVFLLAHDTLREFFDEPLPIKRNGKWQYVNPADWPERRSVTVKPGMSPGERSRRAQSLGNVIDAQMMLADRGMDEVLVDLGGFNRAVMDWCRLNEVQNPEQYFVDPESDQAQAALRRKAEQRETEDMNRKALMQQAFGLEQLRTALAKYQGDADRQFQYFDAVLKSEVEEAKIVGKATADMVNQQRAGAQRANGVDETGTQDSGAGPEG